MFEGYLSFVRKSCGWRFRTWLGDKAVRLEEKAVVVALSKSVPCTISHFIISVLFFLKNM